MMFWKERRQIRHIEDCRSAKTGSEKPMIRVVIVAALALSLVMYASQQSSTTYDVSFLTASTTVDTTTDNSESFQTWKTEFEQSCNLMLESNKNTDDPAARKKSKKWKKTRFPKSFSRHRWTGHFLQAINRTSSVETYSLIWGRTLETRLDTLWIVPWMCARPDG